VAMTRRRRLSDKQVRSLRPGPKRRTVVDPELVGHYVRVMPSGVRSFVAVARDPFGKQVWSTIGTADHIGIEQAREQARTIIARVKSGKPATEPPPPPPDSFADVAANWIKRHVEPKRLRTRGEMERILVRYAYPHWRDRIFTDVRRGDVVRLLDHVEDQHGPVQADKVLTVVRSICNWYAVRNDAYQSPIVKGMRRGTNGARKRILNDDEIRLIWKHAESEATPFAALVQIALLTGQRLGKLLDMRWSDISPDGMWSVPVEEREKGAGGDLALPELALAILRKQPRILGTDLVFPPAHGRRMSPSRKSDFEATLPPMERWVVHDCRRSCRSLLARCGVADAVAERILGHRVGNEVERIYNRHGYGVEKKLALEKLAALIEEIVHGEPSDQKVVPIRARP
jgi:integrase